MSRSPRELAASLARGVGRRTNEMLGRVGFRVVRTRNEAQAAVMQEALHRAANRGIPVTTVVDVGASNGSWSDTARQHYPECNYLLIEANKIHEPALRQFEKRVPRSRYVLAAAGNRIGELYFDGRDPFGGLASPAPIEGSAPVAATTIDHEVAKRGLPGPFLIKLDTHGFELPILEGAEATLRTASLLVIEVYNFTLQPGALRFHEMCTHLAALGFRPIDICDPMFRPGDGVFWQCDLFFARQDRPEFHSNEYA